MLSKRLQAVADMVTEGLIVADIGTDHGYVPIYLTENKIVPLAYAMDINEGPVNKAINNVKEKGLEDRIKVILSDGMDKLKPGMAESVVIAGMGGELIVKILEESKVKDSLKEMVLSPHRDADLVRKYLHKTGWKIIREEMLKDAGKYYVVIKAVQGEDDQYSEVEYIYGKYLLNKRDIVLKEYLIDEKNKFQKIKDTLLSGNSNNIERINNILEINRKGMEAYD